MHLVVLCGGAGTRLWPLSRLAEPKQFLPLPEDVTLLDQTLARASAYGIRTPPIVVCGREHIALVEAYLRRAGRQVRLIVEPERRNTAPAIAAAAALLLEEHGDAQMLVTPADHFIADTRPLTAALEVGETLARDGGIVSFGIAPRSPSTSYGYIELGDTVVSPARRVRRFVEKPSVGVAQEMVRSGRFAWNSGIFLFRADAVLAELRAHAPQIASAAEQSVKNARRSNGVVHLDAEAFQSSPDKSIDYAVMEKTSNSYVIPIDLEWSDLGSWQALWEVMDKDDAGNVMRGDVVAVDSKGSLLKSDGRLLAAVGVKDLVIVETPDAVLVAARDRAEDVKGLVDKLRLMGRSEAQLSALVTRPWGTYQTLWETATFQVKHICIAPGAAISLQYHERRSEYWTVVEGSGVLTLDDQERTLRPGDSAMIPKRARHRLRNTGTTALQFVEVQIGDYLGEDDIVRIADDYGRAQ